MGEAIRRVGTSLGRWDREVLGELKSRIKKAKRELERCKRGGIDQQQVSREHLLRYRLGRLEDQYNV